MYSAIRAPSPVSLHFVDFLCSLFHSAPPWYGWVFKWLICHSKFWRSGSCLYLLLFLLGTPNIHPINPNPKFKKKWQNYGGKASQAAPCFWVDQQLAKIFIGKSWHVGGGWIITSPHSISQQNTCLLTYTLHGHFLQPTPPYPLPIQYQPVRVITVANQF